jgi:hypothetical protein
MTTPQDRVADAVRRGQETVNATVRSWTDGMQSIVSNLDLKSTVPTLDELVDRSYEFGVQLLAMQRDFAKNLIGYAAPLSETLGAAPRKAERFVMKTERTAAKKAEDIAARTGDVAARTGDVAADAGHTAAKAQRSAAARASRASTAKK